MNWIRRNWPDLLMVLALIAVMTGIAATLLTGNNLLPFGSRSTGPTVSGGSSTPAATPSATPQTTPTPATADGGGTAPPTVTIGGADASATTGVVIPVLPALPTDTSDSSLTPAVSPSVPEATTSTATESTATASATTGTTASTPSAAAPAETAASVASAATPAPTIAPSSNAPFRISVGAYGSGENAARRAETFSAAGFPVFTAVQNNLTLVLVGPYDTQAEADQVAARIRTQGLEPNPIIYEFRSEAGTSTVVAPSSTATSPTPTTQTAATPAAPSASTVPAPASSGRYLQVGAYGSMGSATPQRTALENLGFEVRHVEEGGLVKLLVGPYDDAALSQAQGVLRAQGIDSFVR